MTNKKEHKILRKTLSLALTMLVSILGLPLAKPQQVSATETSDPKYLSSITMDATASSSWDKKYSTSVYDDIINNYDNYTSSSPLEIDSAEKLAAFAGAVNVGKKNFSGKYVKLTANIDLGGTNPTVTKKVDESDSSKFSISITGSASNVWVPIGNDTTHFNGTFDGDGHEVSNMTVLVKSTSGNVFAGLFGYIYGGSIKNTGVTGNVYASNSSSSKVYAGGLVGYIYGRISNSYATGNVYASVSYPSFAGGLVGYSSSDSISNSYATGNVYSSSSSSSFVYAGGLVGYNYGGSISNSYATGNVYASASYYASVAGSLVGYIYDSGNISNSYATGNVYTSASTSTVYAGGLVGSSSSSSISNSYATGDVYASSTSTVNVYAGGLVGSSSSSLRSSISNSYATGNVYASSSSSSSANVFAGGLAGYSSISSSSSSNSISNSYATGDVYASSPSTVNVYAGGLVGDRSSDVSITNGYYYSGATIDGGTGATISEDGTGLTMDQMTGTGTGRADDTMKDGFTTDNWVFQADSGRIRYLPRLNVITYSESSNPAPRLLGPLVTPTSSDFDFKAPTNLTYNGSQKVATVTSKISEISDDKITIKYYKDEIETSPIDVGTYIVKIDVAACDKYEAQTDITADHWTFTIAKADPTIGSTSTTATYKPGLTLGNVYPPPCGLGLHGRHVDVA